jgi:hypothetical protein
MRGSSLHRTDCLKVDERYYDLQILENLVYSSYIGMHAPR